MKPWQKPDSSRPGALTNLASASLPGDADIHEGYWDELFAALEERDANHHRAALAVTKLMAVVVREMAKTCEHDCLSFKNKALRSVLAGLRVLGTTIRNNAKFQVHRYRVRFQHPAVGYIFAQALRALVESMEEARYTEHDIQLILRLFRDNIARREPEVRKQLESGKIVPQN